MFYLLRVIGFLLLFLGIIFLFLGASGILVEVLEKQGANEVRLFISAAVGALGGCLLAGGIMLLF